MDYNKLIEHLRECGTYGFKQEECRDAALAIETLLAELARVTAERDGAIKDLNEFLAMDELCPIQCDWCKWNDTFCDGKTPEWRGIRKED